EPVISARKSNRKQVVIEFEIRTVTILMRSIEKREIGAAATNINLLLGVIRAPVKDLSRQQLDQTGVEPSHELRRFSSVVSRRRKQAFHQNARLRRRTKSPGIEPPLGSRIPRIFKARQMLLVIAVRRRAASGRRVLR